MTSWLFVVLLVPWNWSFLKEPWPQSRQDAFVSFQLGLAAALAWEEEVRQRQRGDRCGGDWKRCCWDLGLEREPCSVSTVALRWLILALHEPAVTLQQPLLQNCPA